MAETVEIQEKILDLQPENKLLQADQLESKLTTLRDQWADLEEVDRLRQFRNLPQYEALDFFNDMPVTEQATLIRFLSDAEAALYLRYLQPDDVADLIQTVPAEDRAHLESLLDDAALTEVRALLAYAEDAAGGLMSPRFARLRPDVTTDVAIRYLRIQTKKNLETLHYIYVLDSEQRLCGVVSFHELFAARDDAYVSEVMHPKVITVLDTDDQDTVAQVIAEHDLMALPVVDAEGRMRGIVTVDDIVDVLQEEATEDIQKLGGVQALHEPYLDVSFRTMVQKRGGWLSVLFIGELLTATAMGHFEDEIAKAVVLAMFVPLIISSGGNSGSQAATLIVRSLGIGELKLSDWGRVFRRELFSGLTLGFWLGSLGFLRVILWQFMGLYDFGAHYFLLGITVCFSLIGVVSFGTIVGSMLPFLLQRLKLDPATSSAPFVATLVDVTGLIIYFVMAALILSGTLL
ncbi:magnesium transporter [bacterium]|nr:magnesium transporter [bacterium]